MIPQWAWELGVIVSLFWMPLLWLPLLFDAPPPGPGSEGE